MKFSYTIVPGYEGIKRLINVHTWETVNYETLGSSTIRKYAKQPMYWIDLLPPFHPLWGCGTL